MLPVQIVNKSGIAVGSADMTDAFERQLIRNTSYVMLVDSGGKFLLQKRSELVPNYKGYWDASAGGHIDLGETPELAAYRELEEELGMTNIRLVHRNSFYFESEGDDRIYKYYAHVYSGDIESYDVHSISSCEVETVRFFERDEVNHLKKITPIAKHIINLL